MFEEQKAGLQGQGTISEESGSSREDGRVGQGPNYVSLSQREGTLWVLLRGPRQLKSEASQTLSLQVLSSVLLKVFLSVQPFSFLFLGNSLIITAKIKQLIGSKTLLYID